MVGSYLKFVNTTTNISKVYQIINNIVFHYLH